MSEPLTTVPVWRTSIGKKLLMASASIILFLFIVFHLAGNLKVFLGREHFDHYAEWLRVIGSPFFPDRWVLWIVRALLILALVVHVGVYYLLWLRKRRARSMGYRSYDPQVFSWFSRAMLWGGIAIFAFVAFHLLHLTTGTIQPEAPLYHFQPGDPYQNVFEGFHVWWVTLIYAGGVIALGMHLYHGIWSAMQTFGINNPKYNRFRRPTAAVIAIIITAGFLSIPLTIAAGMGVKP